VIVLNEKDVERAERGTRGLTPAQLIVLYEHRSEVVQTGMELIAAAGQKKESQRAYDQAVNDLMAYVDEMRSGQTRLPLDEAGPRHDEDEESDA